MESLHGDRPPEPAIAEQATDVDRRQATAGQLRGELVASDEERLALFGTLGARVLLLRHRRWECNIASRFPCVAVRPVER